MSEHRVLALKWRPARFSEVVGQDHVVKTLSNALAQNKVAHAYLFTGPRGVGKTTCARILAKAVNCEKGAGPEPCGTCSICAEIDSSRSLDVMEIDAASTGKVDEIRDLRELVRIAPARARKKIFIIDEVHSMKTDAFNALLKTLEEPPPHVIFILATTEARRVPPTIHSRCQRFNFHPIGPNTILSALKKIAEAEKLKIDDPALALIAKAARGAMRDAQMLLEQAAAYASDTITVKDLRELLGLIEHEWVERFLNVLHEGDPKGGMKLLDELLEAGRDPEELLSEAHEQLRDGLMAKLGADVPALSGESLLTAPERRDWFSSEELLTLLGHTRRAMEEIASRQISHPRIAAELALTRMLRRERPLAWEEVQAELDRLGSAMGLPVSAAPASEPRASAAPPLRTPAHQNAAARPGAGPKPGLEAAAAAPRPAASDKGPAELPMEELAQWWPKALERLKFTAPTAYVYLKEVRVTGREGNKLLLVSNSAYHRQGLSSGEMKEAVEKALSDLAGESLMVEVRAPESRQSKPGANPDRGNPSPAENRFASQPAWLDHEPLVKASLEIFSARILERKGPDQK